MSVETEDCIYLSWFQQAKSLKRSLKSNWHTKEIISKNVEGVTTNLEWSEIQIKESYLKVKSFKPRIIVRFF